MSLPDAARMGWRGSLARDRRNADFLVELPIAGQQRGAIMIHFQSKQTITATNNFLNKFAPIPECATKRNARAPGFLELSGKRPRLLVAKDNSRFC
jgi:hypothetical protein